MKVRIWTCTTDGDGMPIETVAGASFESLAGPCRIALREMDWDKRHGTPLDSAEQINDAWQETFDGVCIIESHEIEALEVLT